MTMSLSWIYPSSGNRLTLRDFKAQGNLQEELRCFGHQVVPREVRSPGGANPVDVANAISHHKKNGLRILSNILVTYYHPTIVVRFPLNC